MAYKQNNTTLIEDDQKTFFRNNLTIEGSNSFLYIERAFQGLQRGYVSGGDINGQRTNKIESFLFSTDGNGSDVGDLTVARSFASGQSSYSHGYTSAGFTGTSPASSNVIDKFSFSSNFNSTDVADTFLSLYGSHGNSSTTNGYISGGFITTTPGADVNNIQKFPFATDANATIVGNLNTGRSISAGLSSFVSGYTCGGNIGDGITKYSFASDGNSTTVGNLLLLLSYVCGASSVSYGYVCGGQTPGPAPEINVIQKIPFATDANATDVGDLTTTNSIATGNQY